MLTFKSKEQLPKKVLNQIPVLIVFVTVTAITVKQATAFPSNDSFINWELDLKKVFNNVAHGSTTKRSVPFDFNDPVNSGRYNYRQVYRRPYPAIDVATTASSASPALSNADDNDDDGIATLIGANHVPSNQFRANPTIVLPEKKSMTMPSLPIDLDDYFLKQLHMNKTKSNPKPSNDYVSSPMLPNQPRASQNESQFEYGSISEISSGIDRILGDANSRRNNLSKFLISVADNSPITTVMTTMSTVAAATTTTTTKTTTTTTTTTLAPSKKSISSNHLVKSNLTTSPPPLLPSSPTSRIATNATSDKVWFISWNVHVYLIVLCNLFLLSFSVYKLATFNEKEQFLFHKKHFRLVHSLIITITLLRLFYLTYDSYNMNKTLPALLHDLLNHLPMSLLAITFALLVICLMKRSLSHLRVTRPVFLVFFGLVQSIACVLLLIVKNAIYNRTETIKMIADLMCRFCFILLCCSLGFSYLYMYRIIRNVLMAKKTAANFSELIAQNICYAAHYTIAVALLFLLLGLVQLYGLFAVRNEQAYYYYWIVWAFEFSLRVLEVFIMVLIVIIISLRIEQRTALLQNSISLQHNNISGFPMFPCTNASASVTNTTSDSSTDPICPPPNFDYSLRRSIPPPIKTYTPPAPIGFYTRPGFCNNNNIYSEPSIDTSAVSATMMLERNSRVRASSQLTSSSSSSVSRQSNRKRTTATTTLPTNMGFMEKKMAADNGVDNPTAVPGTTTMLVDDNGFVRFKHLNDSCSSAGSNVINAHGYQQKSSRMASTLAFCRRTNCNYNDC